MQSENSCAGICAIWSSTASWSSSREWHQHPHRPCLTLGKNQKSLGARSGLWAGCGRTLVLDNIRKVLVPREVWQEALSMCSKNLRNFLGLLFWIAYRRLLRIVQKIWVFTVLLKNSRWTSPWQSKKLTNNTFPVALVRMHLTGRCSPGPNHWDDWLLSSGSYTYTQDSSIVMMKSSILGSVCRRNSILCEMSNQSCRCPASSRNGTNFAALRWRCKSFLKMLCTVLFGIPVSPAIARTDSFLSACTTLETAAMFCLDLPLLLLGALGKSTTSSHPFSKLENHFLIRYLLKDSAP